MKLLSKPVPTDRRESISFYSTVSVFPGGPEWEVRHELITALEEHQVFVFAANQKGFHGTGSAGQAQRGDARNTWRSDPAFLKAIDAPAGSPLRVGLWAVLGQARGPMLGRTGKSYAVVTVTDAGKKRSVPLSGIRAELARLAAFAQARPKLEFLVTALGEGHAGYTRGEIGQQWQAVHAQQPLPGNLRFIRLEKL